ncbi:MAG: NAD(P)/FAD-dependent oxidoreductase [Myxococcota bacterium]
MNRRDLVTALLAAPLLGTGCSRAAGGLYDNVDVRFDGHVLVIGAGAAGLAAGYLLDRYGVDYEILEASDRWGGRVGRLDGFLDFPIDLGAEWIHADPSILADLVDDPTVRGDVDVIRYSPQTSVLTIDNGTIPVDFVHAYYGEYKFKRSTWYGFLERFIQPASASRLRLNTPVTAVDTQGPQVRVTLDDGSVEVADRVLLTVPLKILQEARIGFTPPLPAAKQAAIDAVTVTDGLKVFLAFEEKFYPDMTVLGFDQEGSGDHLFIDGAFRKDAEGHLGTLFCVGPRAADYVDLDDADVVDRLVQRLDRAFEGAASRTLLDAHVQNWSREPWIRGAYSYGWSGSPDTIIDELAADVGRQLYWAGSGVSRFATSTVHGAMETGYAAVVRMLEQPTRG